MAVELDGKNGTVCKHAMNNQLIQVSTNETTSKQTSIDISETSTIPMTILTSVSTADNNKQRNSRETRSLLYNTNTYIEGISQVGAANNLQHSWRTRQITETGKLTKLNQLLKAKTLRQPRDNKQRNKIPYMAVELDGKNGTVCKHAINHQLIQESTTETTSKQTSIAISETSTIPMTILTPVSPLSHYPKQLL